ncbi:lytic murein transglycosylase [Candidatus Micrarchaeota archaeon]|nr:lytic murein transglycosylase [Candidatus Micrarchaeota archaeon]
MKGLNLKKNIVINTINIITTINATVAFGQPLTEHKKNIQSSIIPLISRRLEENKTKKLQGIQEMKEYVNMILSDNRLKIHKRIKELFIRSPEKKLTKDEYVKKLVTFKRVNLGKVFMLRYNNDLKQAEAKYGVPKEIIVSILGIESSYGINMGKYDPVSVFVSIILYYPERTEFALSGLTELLISCKENNIDPYTISSSYAGCIGPGQFFPPTWKDYGIDGNNDNMTNMMDIKDVIFSIANMLSKNGWDNNHILALKSYNNSDNYVAAVIALAERLGWEYE